MDSRVFIGISILAIVLLSTGSFLLGSTNACSGQGELIGWKCHNISVIEVCEFGDQYFVPPESDTGINDTPN